MFLLKTNGNIIYERINDNFSIFDDQKKRHPLLVVITNIHTHYKRTCLRFRPIATVTRSYLTMYKSMIW